MPQPKSPLPIWVRVPIYLAAYPSSEFRDFRLNLQKRYRRAERRGGDMAKRLARQEARYWSVVASKRIVWWAATVWKVSS